MKLNVLIVEDDEGLREALAFSLQDMGHETRVASHADEGIALLRQSRCFDVVISDIRMPGKNGVEMTREIRATVADPPPVVLITGFSNVISSEAFRAGAHAILPKPFKISQLEEVINGIYKRATGVK